LSCRASQALTAAVFELACCPTSKGSENSSSCFSLDALVSSLFAERSYMSRNYSYESEAQLIAELRSVADSLCNITEAFPDGWRVLEQARGVALKTGRFYEASLLSASPTPSDDFLFVSHLFRRLLNDTWKLLAGDSAIHIGRGIENEAECKQALMVVLQQLGMFLRLALESKDSVALGEAMQKYKQALVGHHSMVRACETFLSTGEPHGIADGRRRKGVGI